MDDSTVKLIITRLDRQDEQLDRILDQATATNGRLREVEREQERTRGALEERQRHTVQRHWIIGTTLAGFSALIGAVVSILTT